MNKISPAENVQIWYMNIHKKMLQSQSEQFESWDLTFDERKWKEKSIYKAFGSVSLEETAFLGL